MIVRKIAKTFKDPQCKKNMQLQQHCKFSKISFISAAHVKAYVKRISWLSARAKKEKRIKLRRKQKIGKNMLQGIAVISAQLIDIKHFLSFAKK